jgi:hypothetical protein
MYLKNLPIDKFLLYLILILLLIPLNFNLGHALVDDEESDILETDNSDLQGKFDLIKEKIIKISKSGRIFLISNDSEGFQQGDFVSFVKDEKLISRALIIKVTKKELALKIIKIYSKKLWKSLKVNSNVLILRGDEQIFLNKTKINLSPDDSELNSSENDKSKSDQESILSEEDLFSSTNLSEDVNEKGNRIIKPDNLVAFTYGQIEGINSIESKVSYDFWSGAWGHQILDDTWIEGIYGQSSLKSFPSADLKTTLTSYQVRLKYIFAGPIYSYFSPYVGYQIIKAKSPGAGSQQSGDVLIPQEQLDKEKRLLKKIEKSTAVLGISVLKRIVPGWFLKGDIGTDMFNFGISVEF